MWMGESTVVGSSVVMFAPRSATLQLRSDVALKKRKHEFALCYTADLKDTKTIPLIKLQIKVEFFRACILVLMFRMVISAWMTTYQELKFALYM